MRDTIVRLICIVAYVGYNALLGGGLILVMYTVI